MKKYILLVLAFTSFNCTQNERKSTTEGDSAFEKLSEEYIKGYLDWRPQNGVSLGLHE